MRLFALCIGMCLMLLGFSCDTQQKTTASSTTPVTQTRSLPPQTFTPYNCKGNEPFWNIKVEKDKITLRQLGEPIIVYPYQPPVKNGQMIQFETSTEADGKKSVLRFSLEEKQCSDSMSGETSPYTVKVNKDGKEMQGCGNKM